ncbi:hypothetical protein [Listeria booriae]|uniref:hypothetical protein n=1 Tax=Listeria booriae TaxID=1552123 RepID=UPI0016258431|nr:hypothetical protein [Listeria booriae]MBC1226390.1 hypothetical protein [Listeria booriae]
MGDVLEKLFAYIPIALAVSLFLASLRWIVFIFPLINWKNTYNPLLGDLYHTTFQCLY